MDTGPGLRLLVDEKRGMMDVLAAWIPRVCLALAFAFIGASKFNGDPRGEWYKIFEQIGFGQWFRVFTGVMQITGALLLLTRWTLTLGAAMLACTMVGAVIVDISVAHAIGFALIPLILLGLIVVVWLAGRFGATS